MAAFKGRPALPASRGDCAAGRVRVAAAGERVLQGPHAAPLPAQAAGWCAHNDLCGRTVGSLYAHATPLSVQIAVRYLHKESGVVYAQRFMRQDREAPGSIPADATRRSESVQPMELWPGNWAERRAVTWGPRVLDKGRLARTRGLPFCCINLCARATAPSAQMAERHAHRDSRSTRPRWRGGGATAVAGPQPVCPV